MLTVNNKMRPLHRWLEAMSYCRGKGMMPQNTLKKSWEDIIRKDRVKRRRELKRLIRNESQTEKMKRERQRGRRRFPHFQSGRNGTQSACRLERNQLYLLLLSPFSFSLFPEQTKRKRHQESCMCLREPQKQYTLYNYFCPPGRKENTHSLTS